MRCDRHHGWLFVLIVAAAVPIAASAAGPQPFAPTTEQTPPPPTEPAPAAPEVPPAPAEAPPVILIAPSLARTWSKLGEIIDLDFEDDTPLSDVLAYIKRATQGPNDLGLPIHVDPIGLADAEQSMTSTIKIKLEGIPLSTTLRLILSQLGLDYHVRDDGLLLISSEEEIDLLKENSTTLKHRVKSLEEELEKLRAEIAELKALIKPKADSPQTKPR